MIFRERRQAIVTARRLSTDTAMPRIALLALLAFAGTSAVAGQTADYAREERWAQEIVPSLVDGDAVYLATPARARVLAILTEPAGVAAGGIVLVHGLGVHPDWGLIGGLRTGLAEAGFVTLSVQMPVLAANATRDDYAPTLPEAAERIAVAVDYLRAKGAKKIAIVSHSLGASMANAFLARPGAVAIDAWAPVGMFGAFAVAPKEPVLDVVAETEIAPVSASAPARIPALPKDACSRQVVIAGADHYFEYRQKELVAAIAAFLSRAFDRRC
jgi:alpha/beta superfamily hydrolase